MISVFPVQFSIQIHKCTLSLSNRPILRIFHVSLKMRIPHYARQRIINQANSGGIQGNSGEIRWKAFHFFSLVFPGVKYISLLGKSNSSDFPSGHRENCCEKKWKGIPRETGILFPFHLLSPSPPTFICRERHEIIQLSTGGDIRAFSYQQEATWKHSVI